MRVAVGSDERTHLAELVVEKIRSMGHEVQVFGDLAGEHQEYPIVAEEVARRVASGECQEGVVMCWTGTGVTIAANKVPGVRAALCADAETARGARRWNHANVLALSLRLTSDVEAQEILEAWFSSPFGQDPVDHENVARIAEMERRYRS